MAEPVRTTVDGAVAVVALSKPPHNLIDGGLIDGMIDAFEGAAEAGALAILLNSDMKHFCAGADVDGLGGDERRSTPSAEVLERLEDVPLPTVASVNGLALGGGFELALACDFIVAGSSAGPDVPFDRGAGGAGQLGRVGGQRGPHGGRYRRVGVGHRAGGDPRGRRSFRWRGQGPAPPWNSGAGPLPDAGLPPFQGEHNREVLAEIGLAKAEIEALASRQVTLQAKPH